ncbi:ATP-binding protein [Pseudomonas sp.]|uniref:sensor histidine kinase n=1 Tax=Pseudomonas sp. TaxID=306 RepID=UPI003241DFDF
MLGHRSLYWRMVLLVAGFCLCMIAVTDYAAQRVDSYLAHLPESTLRELRGYAADAASALDQGVDALNAWRDQHAELSPEILVVVDAALQALPGQPLSDEQRNMLTFLRSYTAPMSMRGGGRQVIYVPMQGRDESLVLRLPESLTPWAVRPLLNALVLYLMPALLSLLFCALLYMLLISPLERLRRQANAMRANPLETLLPVELVGRRDELGELGRSLDYLTRRLRDSIGQQRQLLRDVSHELRTPLSRLRVAAESDLSQRELRERLEHEVDRMQELLDGTLEVAWLDSQPGQLQLEAVDLNALWEVLREDALFESGWAPERISAELPDDCRVQGHLNGLSQALENVLRNAIRHSPDNGLVQMRAQREGANWLLCLADQGPGVEEAQLEQIFRPFSRLNSARPGDGGFGLGLAIAERQIRLQGGRIWARNGHPGLQLWFRLRAV